MGSVFRLNAAPKSVQTDLAGGDRHIDGGSAHSRGAVSQTMERQLLPQDHDPVALFDAGESPSTAANWSVTVAATCGKRGLSLNRDLGGRSGDHHHRIVQRDRSERVIDPSRLKRILHFC